MAKKRKYKTKKCVVCGKSFEFKRHITKKSCSEACLKILKNVGKKRRMQSMRDSIKKKYGVDHPSHMKDFIKKVKKTKRERYGNENYNNRDLSKKTNLEKYGVDNPKKLKEVVEKTKKTLKERYGDENYNNRELSKKTTLKKYGVKHHLLCKDVLNKHKATNLKRYGVEYNIHMDKCKENRIASNREKYGVDCYFSSKEHLQIKRESSLENIKTKLKDKNLKLINEDEYTRIREKSKNKYSYNKYFLECQECGNIFYARLVENGLICRECNPKTNGLALEKEVGDFVNEYVTFLSRNDKEQIKPLELDLFLPQYNIAIEFNGNYWHSEVAGGKDKKYHLNKTKLCKEKNIKLIHIFEDEWVINKDIVKSDLLKILDETKDKIPASSCEIKKVSKEEREIFLNENHLEGDVNSSLSLGLYFENELVSLMSFRKKKANSIHGNAWELLRFCSKKYLDITGDFSKLFSFFVKNYNPSNVNAFLDCRWNGMDIKSNIYYINDFKFIKFMPPIFFYIKKNNSLVRYNKNKFKKLQLLEEFGGDKNLTIQELAFQTGFDRIWDCGSMKFEWIK